MQPPGTAGATLAAAGGLTLLTAVVAVGAGAALFQDVNVKEIVTERLIIKDATGFPRMRLEVDSGNFAWLRIRNPAGVELLQLGASPTGDARLRIFSPGTAIPRIRSGHEAAGGRPMAPAWRISAPAASGFPRATLGMTPGTVGGFQTGLLVFDTPGLMRVQATATDTSPPGGPIAAVLRNTGPTPGPPAPVRDTTLNP